MNEAKELSAEVLQQKSTQLRERAEQIIARSQSAVQQARATRNRTHRVREQLRLQLRNMQFRNKGTDAMQPDTNGQ